MANATLIEIAQSAVKTARAKGAQEAAANLSRSREVETVWRDGKLEKTQEATTRSIDLDLYVDGRYASVSSSDLRPEAGSRMNSEALAVLSPQGLREAI